MTPRRSSEEDTSGTSATRSPADWRPWPGRRSTRSSPGCAGRSAGRSSSASPAPTAPRCASGCGGADAERWFEPGSPITRVHGDASMFVGGLSALLLQSLHPLAMAGVDAALRLPRRPVGPAGPHQPLPRRHDVRLRRRRRARRSTRCGPCTGGSPGVAPDGRPYAASDPHLLAWVHVAEVDSFLRAYQRYGADAADRRRGATSTSPRPAASPPRSAPSTCRRPSPSSPTALAALPPRAGRHARGPGGGPLPRRQPAAAAGACARRTCRSPAPPWPCCRAGPAGRCACRGCRSPRRRSPAPAARPSPARSAGRCPAALSPVAERRSTVRARSLGARRLAAAAGAARRSSGVPFTVVAGRRRRDAAARRAAARPRPPAGRRQGAAGRRRPGAGGRHDRRGRRRDPRQAGRRRRRPADAAAGCRAASHRVHTGVAVRVGRARRGRGGDDDRHVRRR